MMEPVQVLCTLRFTAEVLAQLRAVSPRLQVTQQTCHDADEVAAALADRPGVDVHLNHAQSLVAAIHLLIGDAAAIAAPAAVKARPEGARGPAGQGDLPDPVALVGSGPGVKAEALPVRRPARSESANGPTAQLAFSRAVGRRDEDRAVARERERAPVRREGG